MNILQQPNLEEFKILLFGATIDDMESFKNISEELLQVEFLTVYDYDEKGMLEILPIFDPHTLIGLTLDGVAMDDDDEGMDDDDGSGYHSGPLYIDLSEIMELDQWKMSEYRRFLRLP
ncbi:hypothetical protein GCK72_021452 [Caenorhabditis remanei]|uniref:DUF38 domain-containing protein n=1 Tax=Caenorhabditis remanei TaxID=31234 RepID=A0A6A5GI67_CAERE|nr:hypothetical protein GCK72_021452 [Caenorhabditis remanei]KAF1754887.1 hypothetical protein GCK72_021452 [Caenorhabditis remanei]